MARIRTIKPEFWVSEQVVECSTTTRLLFIGLLNFCDDNGVHPASLLRLKMEVFPADNFSLDAMRSFIDELVASGLLVSFSFSGADYWQVTGWHHQRIDKPYYKYPYLDNSGAVVECSTTTRRMVVVQSTPERKGKECKVKDSKSKSKSKSTSNGEVVTIDDNSTTRKTRKHKISKSWTPDASFDDWAVKNQISMHFYEPLIDEFIIYWTERGDNRPGWTSTFINHVKRKLEQHNEKDKQYSGKYSAFDEATASAFDPD